VVAHEGLISARRFSCYNLTLPNVVIYATIFLRREIAMKSTEVDARNKKDAFLASIISDAPLPDGGCMLATVSGLSWVDMIRRGLPGQTVAALSRKMGVSQKNLADWLHVTPRSLQRYTASDANLSPELSDRVAQLIRVYCRCNEVFKDEEKASVWLRIPNYALGNVPPMSLFDTTPGIEMVLDELGRIEHGVFI
jgi:putative toxin-antitoxin system antitoxin component (TIGR02293 family)